MKKPNNKDQQYARVQIYKILTHKWGASFDRQTHDYIKYVQSVNDNPNQDKLDKLQELKRLNDKGYAQLNTEEVAKAANTIMGVISSLPSAVLLRAITRGLLALSKEHKKSAFEETMSQKPSEEIREVDPDEVIPGFLETRFSLVTKTAQVYGGSTANKVFNMFGMG